MFQVGDRVVLIQEDSESSLNAMPIGSEGEVVRVDQLVRVLWDNPGYYDYTVPSYWYVPSEYHGKRIYGVFAESLGSVETTPQPYRRIIRKINQMETRWKKFQERKHTCTA